MPFRRGPRVPFRARYRTSRAIFRESLALVRKERDLWRFPAFAALSMLATFIVIGLVTWGAFALGVPLRGWAMLAALPILLLVSYPFTVLAALCNAALLVGVHERMARRKCSPAQAWARARAQLGPIARFSLLALLVSGLLAAIGQLLDKLRLVPYVGQALQMVGAMAWAVASFFVIPVLVLEREQRALAALRASAELARGQWGKATAGMVTIGLVFLVPFFVAIAATTVLGMVLLPVLLSTALHPSLAFALAMGPFALLIVVFLLVAVPVQQAAMTAYQAGLYRFVRTGKVPRGFSQATIVDAWAPYRT